MIFNSLRLNFNLHFPCNILETRYLAQESHELLSVKSTGNVCKSVSTYVGQINTCVNVSVLFLQNLDCALENVCRSCKTLNMLITELFN